MIENEVGLRQKEWKFGGGVDAAHEGTAMTVRWRWVMYVICKLTLHVTAIG